MQSRFSRLNSTKHFCRDSLCSLGSNQATLTMEAVFVVLGLNLSSTDGFIHAEA